jgi:hypothetical protein
MVKHKSNKQTAYNQSLREDTRDRIREAMTNFIRQNDWLEGITSRYKRLCTIKISGGTLYKHKDLWHPAYQVPKEDVKFGSR